MEQYKKWIKQYHDKKGMEQYKNIEEVNQANNKKWIKQYHDEKWSSKDDQTDGREITWK